MAAENLAVSFDPTEMVSIRGKESASLRSLEEIAAPLGRLARAVLPELEVLKGENIGAVDIIVDGPDDVSGTIRLKVSQEGEISVILRGQLGSELPTFRGTPYVANYDGTFFRQPSQGEPVIVEDGAEVKKGQMVAWAFKTKGVQWPENALASGVVHFAIDDETSVEKGTTVMYYIEEA